MNEDEPIDACWDLVRNRPGGRGQRTQLRGRVFGRLRVLESAGSNKHGATLWKCSCVCGKEKVVPGAALQAGRVREITCRIVRLGDSVEVTLVTPTWAGVGHYVIESSTLEALPDGDYIAQWTFLRPGGTAYRIERAFTLTEGIVSDHS